MTKSIALFAVVFAAACTTTTTTTGGLTMPSEDRIHISVVDSGTGRGARVEYRVDATVEDTARAILTVEARPENSELVAAAHIVRRNVESGLIHLRFHPALGVRGTAEYRFRADDTRHDEYRYRFQISPVPEGGVSWRVRGSYTVRETDDGCRVIYEFTSTHAALRRDQLMRLIRQDSTTIMDRAEGR